MEISPHILHFSGHGGSEEGISFKDDDGNSFTVGADTLGKLFKVLNKELKIFCVVLNSCWSEQQGVAINLYVPYVVGMSHQINDKSAVAFSAGFYKALSAGKSVEDAVENGNLSIAFAKLPGDYIPKLLINEKLLDQYANEEAARRKAEKARKQQKEQEMTERNKRDDRSIIIGGNVSGSAIISGKGNNVNINSGGTQEASTTNISLDEVTKSLSELKIHLAGLSLTEKQKRRMILQLEVAEAALDEDDEKHVDKSEVASSVKKVLEVAKTADDFLAKSASVGGHVKKIGGWLGAAGATLLQLLS